MFVPTDWSSVNDQDLVDALIAAASAGNEYDNREAIQDAKSEVLSRLNSRRGRSYVRPGFHVDEDE